MRFVLRYGGKGPPPEADVDRVRALPDAVIVDASSRMLLVESEPEALRHLVDGLAGWVMAPEHTYPVPDRREHVEGPPS